jgi:hypothetical protein
VIDVFISHSAKDRDFVVQLVTDIRKAGFEPFFDQLLDGGESWANSLMEALAKAGRIVVVLSPDSVQSEWVKKETVIGLWHESLDPKISVIPLLLRPCPIPDLLAGKVYADFSHDYNEGLASLLLALGGTADTGSSQPTPGTDVVEPSPSEIASLRAELAEAVALFKANPPRRLAVKSTSSTASDGRKICFVVMPFSDKELQVVFEDYVRPTIEDRCNLKCERGDDVFGSNVIMDDIQNSIARAHIIVADLTRKNANVFYEVGICHALDKSVLLLAQSMDDVPFDLRHRRVLLYEYSPRGATRLANLLTDHLNSMVATGNPE